MPRATKEEEEGKDMSQSPPGSPVEKSATVEPPVCFRDETCVSTVHGDTRRLPYHWLGKKRNPKVKDFLAAENRYAESIIPEAAVTALYKEQRARIKDVDASLPFLYRGFFHYVRDVEGKDFEVHCRRPYHSDPNFVQSCVELLRRDPSAVIPEHEDEEILLDLNSEAKLHNSTTVELGDVDFNPSQTWLAYTLNLSGEEEHFTLFVKDITSGLMLRVVNKLNIPKLGPGCRPGPHVVWADDQTLYFTVSTAKGRTFAVARCDVGAVYTAESAFFDVHRERIGACGGVTAMDANADPALASIATPLLAADPTKRDEAHYKDGEAGLSLVYKEKDKRFTVESLCRTHDDDYVAFCCCCPNSTEWWFAPVSGEDAQSWNVVWPRRRDVQYSIYTHPFGWLISHDVDNCVNRRLDLCAYDGAFPLPFDRDAARLTSFIRYDPQTVLEDVDTYRDFVLITVLKNGFTRVLAIDLQTAAAKLATGPLEYSDFVRMADVIARCVPGSGLSDDDLCSIEVTGDSDGFSDTTFRVRVESMRQLGRLFQIRFDKTKKSKRHDAGRANDDSISNSSCCWTAELQYEGTLRAGQHNPAEYRAELVFAPAPPGVAAPRQVELAKAASVGADEVNVPIALVYRIDTFERGRNPLLLEAYGSYGDADLSMFHPDHKSFLDRGVVLAFAMVRGGGHLGPAWHEAGRLLCRPNSITDFVACAAHLVKEQWCHPDRLAATGGSAGATVVGGAMLRRPDLFRAVVLAVPFVDCLTTMLDSALPLTEEEFDEWGNPRESAEVYHTMKSYSPMDNVPSAQEAEAAGIIYPHVLIDSSLHDSRVGVQEPAGFGAALRAAWGPSQAAGRRLLHRCNFKSDHGGASSRYDSARNSARTDVFILGSLGVSDGN